MKVQLNPGTRVQMPDGSLSEYGAQITVSNELGIALTTGPNPSGVEVSEPASATSVPPPTNVGKKKEG